MIVWRSHNSGGMVIGLGLEAGNIEKLKKGQPIFKTLEMIGIEQAAVCIHYGETKEAIIAEMETMGVVPREGAPPPKHGPTGAYPHGKLSPDDEGEISALISAAGDLVRLDFGKELSWLAMTRHEAKEFGARLIAMAGETKDN